MSRRLPQFVVALFLVTSAAHAASLDAEMKVVEKLRGLTFAHPVVSKTITRAELPKVLRAQMEKSLPYSPDDYAVVLRALQLVDGGKSDLVGSMLALYESQVLAFYDPLTHTYFAIDKLPPAAEGIGDSDILRQSVVIHELTHALQDQRFRAGARDLALQKDTDGGLALHSLLEGEATLVMLDYVLDKAGQKLDDVLANPEVLSMMTSSLDAADKTVGSSTPRYFAESLKFPYSEGLKLVIDGYRRGGWKMVDRMDENPPRSTREVLHPAEYFARLAGAAAPAAAFDDKSPIPHALTVEHLGEFHWRFLVGDAGAGWMDDRVTVVQNAKSDPTVLVDTHWENAERALAFSDAYGKFLRGRGLEPKMALDGLRVRAAYGADAKLVESFVR
ncbi:MAG TPA: hypothetical protein VHY33_09885 [Thermoanaerobaculia bacterium]|jgi:hypothetical protein|nr:hypothetical protein [Thermoanaerobaculia bacterium]